MIYPWAPWLVAAGVLAAAIIGWFWMARLERSTIRLANTDYLRALPSFRRERRRHRAFAVVALLLLAVAAGAAALTAGRPVDPASSRTSLANRDIVLCMDVSGSMTPYAAEVARVYSDMAMALNGERVSLTVWNYTATQVFPLSDDYSMVRAELEAAAEVLGMDGETYNSDPRAAQQFDRFMAATFPENAQGSSLIGDGLATCVQAFDLPEEERSRTVILATDNEPNGDQLFTLPAAVALAAERGVTVHGIFAASYLMDSRRAEMERAIATTGGVFHDLSDPNAAGEIVEKILAEEAAKLEPSSEVLESEEPQRFYLWLLAPVSLLTLLWWRRAL